MIEKKSMVINQPVNLLNLDKYKYLTNKPWLIRIMYFVAVCSWLLAIYGLLGFLSLSLWNLVVFGPLVLIIGYYRLAGYLILSQYPGFSKTKHLQKVKNYWDKHSNKHPSVDVFLPICGEDLDLIEETWKCVKLINYDNFNVYVLDDGGDARAQALSEEYGFKYLSRPNRGEYKKAGNLKYAYDRSHGEFVLILDADFIPHPDVIRETVPYMEDEQVGILQTPQYFRPSKTTGKISPIEFGAAVVVEEFYRITQVCTSYFKSAMCVGTSALYRRSAINDAGGPPMVTRSEDIRQGLSVMKVGYYVKFIPIILSAGVCPDNPQSYFKQHNRWSTGTVEMITAKDFWSTPMNFIQRVIYVQGPLYYLCEVLGLFLTFQLYTMLFFFPDKINFQYSLLFLPHIFMLFVVFPLSRQQWSWPKVTITASVQIFTYLITYVTVLSRKLMEWQPTNQVSLQFDGNYIKMVWANVAYFSVSLFLVITAFLLNFAYFTESVLVIVFWLAFNLFQNALSMGYNLFFIYRTKIQQLHKNLISLSEFHFWRWRLAGVVGSLSFLLLGAVSVVALSNNTPLRAVAARVAGISENRAKQEDPTPIPSILPIASVQAEADQPQTQTETPFEEPSYALIVQNGDSMSMLTRKIIRKYEAQNKKELSREKRLYVETQIIQEKGNRNLQIGEIYIVEKSMLQKYTDQSDQLSPAELRQWREFSKQVTD
jgi:cellulose synthase (UDP-forming)